MEIWEDNDKRALQYALDMDPQFKPHSTRYVNLVPAPRPGEDWFYGHGGDIDFTKPGVYFLQRSIEAAAWFTTERGDGPPTMYTLKVNIIWPARLRDLHYVVKQIGVTEDQLWHLSDRYDDYMGYLFVPNVVKRLIGGDFDGYVGWDSLERIDIQTCVPFRPAWQIKVIDKKVWR